MNSDALWAFDAYEAVRTRLPDASFSNPTREVANLAVLADDFDVFLLDAFGVLNIGDSAIAQAPERIAALQAAGKKLIIVSNAASMPKRVLLEKYARLGFHFDADHVLSSRAVLLEELARAQLGHIGLMGIDTYGREEFDHLDFSFLADDPETYQAADSFVLLGSGQWSAARQNLLEGALKTRPRPVLVGNPDIVAPRERGLSREPGYYAHLLADKTGATPQFFGKPFANIFDMALAMLPAGTSRRRIIMVGDTLQTDILGGRAAGLSTALITDHGALKGMDAADAIRRSGITPDFIMPNP